MPERIIFVKSVKRDENKKALQVRIQYIKEGKLLHDVIFQPTIIYGKKWLEINERIVGNFIPKKRYLKMIKKAAAIIYDKKMKRTEQPNLSFNI